MRFIAWPGAASDGAPLRARGAGQGAAELCLVESQGVERLRLRRRHAVAALPGLEAGSRRASPTAGFGQPVAAAGTCVAVTGTNGKTSHRLVAGAGAIVASAGPAAALIGTLGVGLPGARCVAGPSRWPLA